MKFTYHKILTKELWNVGHHFKYITQRITIRQCFPIYTASVLKSQVSVHINNHIILTHTHLPNLTFYSVQFHSNMQWAKTNTNAKHSPKSYAGNLLSETWYRIPSKIPVPYIQLFLIETFPPNYNSSIYFAHCRVSFCPYRSCTVLPPDLSGRRDKVQQPD